MKRKTIKDWEKELKEMPLENFYDIACAVNNVMVDLHSIKIYQRTRE